MRVPIAQRPKRVDSRHEFGHFESDTVIGTAPSKRCIDTQVERKSRRLFARFIEDKSALATARCVCSIESGPCERVDVFHVSGRFWSTSACGEKRTPARPAWTSFPS